ncbi:MAG TPA: VWA domain-containing protein [Thermoplasmata archaeon]|nr:VWA domain-containing protein [Thermoplasmata archaeon]
MSVDAHDASARMPLPTTARERNVLVLDLSKSMLAPLPDSGGNGPEKQKIEVARTAVYRILENAETSGAFFGLVTFTETVRVAVPLTEIRRENLPYIESLISMLTPSGRSAIWDAIAVGADLLRTGNGVEGNLVLVTDGWDNASTRFTVTDPGQPPAPGNHTELGPYLLPPGSNLSLKVIGIGSGSERDKGVDSGRMGRFLDVLGRRAAELQVPTSFTYQEVVTGSQLFAQMVNAFLDVDFEGARGIDQLHPEELARHAADAARALKQPQQHATVGRLTGHLASPAATAEIYDEAPSLEVDVLSTPNGAVPAYLKERYGPLGSVIEAYLSRDYGGASERLQRSASMLPPVTVHYWAARIHFAKGEIVEAARALLTAWGEADKLPPTNRGRVVRRLALLQAKLQNDAETEALIQFIDETEAKLVAADPAQRARLMELFRSLLELRGSYQRTSLSGATGGDSADAASAHEAAVERAFGLLQDARLENTRGDAVVEGALDFVEICLAEMR